MSRWDKLSDDDKAHIVYALRYVSARNAWPGNSGVTWFASLADSLAATRSARRGLKRRGWVV